MFNTYRFLFWLSLLIIFCCCIIATYIVTRRRLRPFARNLLIGLILFELLLAFAHLEVIENTTLPPFWRFFFNLQFELTLGAIFSAFQLAMVGMIAFVNGWRTPELKWWQRAYWVLLTVTFVYLSLDEYHAYHETLGGRVPTEFWRIPYAIAGIILFAISAAVYFYGSKIPLRLFIMIFMGLMIAAIAGIGIEEFVIEGFVRFDSNARWMYVFEETFEMVGATIILAGVLSYMQEFIPESDQRLARRFLFSSAGVILAWYFFAQFMLPGIQARYFAEPANVHYDNGRMTLLAYTVKPDVVEPGDEIIVEAYWRANDPLPEDYSFSLHALAYPDGNSVAQSDNLHMGVIPSQAWFPNVVMKQKYYIQLPRNLETPVSLGIMARVWYGPWPFLRPWQDTTGLPVADFGELDELAFDAVVLDRVVAVTNRELDDPLVLADYHFPQEDIQLTGYSLPQETVERNVLPISFWWETPRQQRNREDLSQMLHLISVADGELYTFDRPPFSGRFPMTDWVNNMEEISEWEIKLPDDFPPGEYEVYTGIYDWQTGTRRTVIGSEQDAFENGMIYLGNIDYEPNEEAMIAGLSLENYCYGVANFDVARNSEDDTLIAINRTNGEAQVIGALGTFEVENLTFSADGSVLHAVEELDDIGQFGAIDLQTGTFNPIGDGIVLPNQPAISPVWGGAMLRDVDGIDIDRTTGLLWAITQDADNFLFQINPETGEIVRDVFGQGIDYVKVEVGQFDGAEFVDVEGFAIHPQTGEFYIIAASDDYISRLARIDFDTLNPAGGTVQAVDPKAFSSAEIGEALLDVEGLSFSSDGNLYITNSNNSNSEEILDSLWQVDISTGNSTWVDSMENYVNFVDFESVACYTG